ncbi:MAG: hypothetical protein ABIS06_19640 [Vicinamibacterales bacterium]
MRLIQASVVAVALAACTVSAQDADRKVAGGGITAKGWQGKIDPGKQNEGKSINDSKFMEMDGGLHLQVGPAAVYWNPANTATGDYMVKATFKETKVASDHPHPYGLFIGGSKLDTETPSFVYCVAYGNGDALVRGFSEGKVVQVSKRAPSPAVNKAAADGGVTQEIAWSVKGDKAECMVNGTVVASLPKADLVGPGKLESTDGVYGIRVSHNLDVLVTGFEKK